MIGGFLGDFLKGRLIDQHNLEVLQGVRLHRAIDVFTDSHNTVKQSHRRFDDTLRRYAPIICDIAYDHFLAQNWSDYSDTSLEDFSHYCYETVLQSDLPENAKQTLQRMQYYKALQSYQYEIFVENALISISKRLKRDNPLDTGYAHFIEHRQGLETDFKVFMPEVISFAKQWIEESKT